LYQPLKALIPFAAAALIMLRSSPGVFEVFTEKPNQAIELISQLLGMRTLQCSRSRSDMARFFSADRFLQYCRSRIRQE